MSGETEGDVSGWTVDTLHSHIAAVIDLLRQQIERQWADERRATDIALKAHDEALKVAAVTSEKAITAALNAQKEAVGIAQTFADQRAASMNEWRRSLDDVLTKAMPRQEAEAAIQRATERIQEIVLAQQHTITRAELEAARSRDSERITELATRVTKAEALAQGAQANKAGMFAAIGAAVGLIAIIVFIANYITGK
jgi:hypothetical protein